MPRNLTSQTVTQLESRLVRPVLLVSCAFADNTVYMHTGVGSITWNGQTWLGLGKLANITTISEGSEVQANGITLTLSGIPTDLLDESMNEMMQGKFAQVYLGFMDTTGALVPDPIPAFIGLLDQPVIDISTETATISINVENRLADLNRTRGGRLTDADQRSRYPNDGSLRWVHYLQDMSFRWQ